MIFGLLAGQLLRSRVGHWGRVGIFVGLGVVGLAAGWAMDRFGICPMVKRIWTPGWVVFSTGWALLMLAGFYLVIDVMQWRGWAWPLVVAGMNSIAIYCLWQLSGGWIKESMRIHFGGDVFQLWGWVDKMWVPTMERGFVLVVLWGICVWMYRKKVFVRI